MSGAIHYEVFFKKNRKSGWALVEAQDSRDAALKLAQGLLARSKDGSARVSKEVYDEDRRTFRSVAVFQGGAEAYDGGSDREEEAKLPCLTPDDLSKPHARHTIKRVLTGWLERMHALPMELLHRADLVENLEASGTELQHAVQKVAVASAREQDANVQTFVKQLNELVQKALGRVYKDARDAKLPEYPKQAKFDDIATGIFKGDKRAYTLRAAMADRLRHERKYGDKLEALLDMADNLPAAEDARNFALTEVDSYVAEVISFDAGRAALLGECKDLGETVERLTCLFDGDGKADALRLAPKAARRLAEWTHSREFDGCRAVIAQSLLKELERPARLRPSSVREEVRLARDLASRLVISSDSLLPADGLIKTFAARSARLLQPEIIDELVKNAADIDEEVSRLLLLEENLVGEANKSKLAGYVRATIGSAQADGFYVRGGGQPLERLSRLTSHQARVLKGSYPKEAKLELAGNFDALGVKIIDHSKILNMVESGDRPALDKAAALLRLATGGALPIGRCSTDAQARALRQIKSAAGVSEAQNEDGRTKLKAIHGLLQQLAAEETKVA